MAASRHTHASCNAVPLVWGSLTKNKSYETDTTNRLLEDGLRDESSGYNPVYDLKECSSQRRYGRYGFYATAWQQNYAA